jgi:putative acetyltransferase
MKPWNVRDERPGDEPAIAALTAAAFRDVAHSSGNEARIVERLRHDGDLALSLVLVNGDHAIIGHAAFSPVSISGDGAGGWYGLGPVSVIPLRQSTGIGSALIERGLVRLKESGARGCVVLGEPGYYGRFGFRQERGLAFPGPPPEYFQVLSFDGAVPAGVVRYAPAFG